MTKKRPGSFFTRFPGDGSKMGRKDSQGPPIDFRAQGPTDFRALGPDVGFFIDFFLGSQLSGQCLKICKKNPLCVSRKTELAENSRCLFESMKTN